VCVCVFFVYIFDASVMDTEIGHKLMGKKDGIRIVSPCKRQSTRLLWKAYENLLFIENNGRRP